MKAQLGAAIFIVLAIALRRPLLAFLLTTIIQIANELVDLIEERLAATPPAERPHLTDLGPWYDVCRTGCCENKRLGFQPALAGLAE